MQRITWYRLLVVGALAAPMVSRAQVPQPKVREIATLPGVEAVQAVRLPNGKVVLYTTGDSIMAYDVIAKHAALVTRGFDYSLTVSRSGDRIAFIRHSEDSKANLVWSMPLNPNTGLAAGPAQRVSTRPSFTPSFSPDGKVITFVSFGSDSCLLVALPATGGIERILSGFGKPHWIGTPAWSSDGKSVFVQYGGARDTSGTLERVPSAGGRSERSITYSHPFFSMGSVDGQLALYRGPDGRSTEMGRIAYRTAFGDQGEFRIPPQSYPGSGIGTAHSLLVQPTRSLMLHVLSLADGKIRDVPLDNVLPGTIRWSPDGSRIAVQAREVGHPELVVMHPDGSAQRRYAVPDLSTGMSWSPDGATLAFLAEGGTKILLMDLASGRTRTLAVSSSGFGSLAWRSDGKSVVSSTRIALNEYRLDGTQRLLRNVATEYPGLVGVFMIDDNSVWLDYGKGAPKRFLVMSVADGKAKVVPGPDGNSGPPSDGFRGRTMITERGPNDRHVTELSFFSASGEPARTISLPFEREYGVVQLFPDNQHVILSGKTAGDSVAKFFVLPLNGGTPRAYGGITGVLDKTNWFNSSLSPDGKVLAFTTMGAPVSKIYELDLTPLLQAIGKR